MNSPICWRRPPSAYEEDAPSTTTTTTTTTTTACVSAGKRRRAARRGCGAAARRSSRLSSRDLAVCGARSARVGARSARRGSGPSARRSPAIPAGATRVRDYVKLPRAIRFADKARFTLGVVGLLVTQFVATEHPSVFHAYYLATAPFIFSHRAYQYFVIKYHYFLIDFCYYANAAHFWQILCRPRSARFFKTTFAYANGPILWAIPLWRNSLVFHSHDKVQSVYIHCVPERSSPGARAGTDRAISASPAPPRSFFGSGDDDSRRRAAASAKASLELFSAETSFATSFAHFFVFPTLGYLAWQCAYLLKTELWDVKPLDEDPELVTSLRWLANDYKAGVTRFALRVGRAIGAFGKEELFDAGSLKTKFVFVTLQLVYTVVTFVPIPLCYQQENRAHVADAAGVPELHLERRRVLHRHLLAALRAQVRGGRALRRDGGTKTRRTPRWTSACVVRGRSCLRRRRLDEGA